MKNFYLIKIQYLGFRYSGWQKQTNSKTVQKMVEKTLAFVFQHTNFKTIGAGRTDAKVSAEAYYFQFIIDGSLNNETFSEFKKHLPPDINALSYEQCEPGFNLIGSSKLKTYQYFFCIGDERPHAFCAPFMLHFPEIKNLELMIEAAKMFEGQHDFKNFAYKPNSDTETLRKVILSIIKKNDIHKASFFPETSYVFELKAQGFLRHQVRIMMGSLIELGEGKISLKDLQQRLSTERGRPTEYKMAPSSALILSALGFD